MEFMVLRLVVAMASVLGVAGAVALVGFYSRWKKKNVHKKFLPRAVFNQYGILKDLESFGDYVGKIISYVSFGMILNCM
jgi:hypothetical protein